MTRSKERHRLDLLNEKYCIEQDRMLESNFDRMVKLTCEGTKGK